MGSQLLASETVIDLTTVARVNILRGLVGYQSGITSGLAADAETIGMLISMVSRMARKSVMKRAFKKAQYTERFDVRPGQTEFIVTAAPVSIPTDIDTDITAYNNSDNPRSFTGSDDEVDADYIICDPARQRRGAIYIEDSLCHGVDTLQITYTGGLATETVVSGVNGATSLSGTSFTSTGQTFTTKGVAAGDILAITSENATDHGLWRISAVASETQLTIGAKISTDTAVSAFTANATGLVYEIIDGGTDTIVGLYPHIATAIDAQVQFMFQQRARAGIQSESIVGASVTHIRPFDWLPVVLHVLQMEAL